MVPPRRSGLALALVLAAACGDEVRTVSLERIVPSADPECGAPVDARTLRVAAVGDFPSTDATAQSVEIGIGEPLAIDAFPVETRALEVEVLGAGGALRTIGRTLEFNAAELEGGEVVRVFMAPPNGVCRTGPPARSRRFAAIAPSLEDLIVVGGFDEANRPVTRPEIYRHQGGRFTEIVQDTYGDPENGIAGASLTPLAGGRLVLAGGALNAFQVYDPESGRFSEPPNLLTQARAFHAAVALDENRVLFAGGCGAVAVRRCDPGTELASTAILDVETGTVSPGPALAFLRIGGQAFLEANGTVLLVGGLDGAGGPVLAAERIDPQLQTAGELVGGVAGQGVRLASGAVVAAYGPAGGAATGEGSAIAPGADTGAPLIPAAPRVAPTMTELESGRVLAFGGGASGTAEAALFAPLQGRFFDLDTVPVQGRRGHVAARLSDGSVLILGGEDAAGEHLGDALVFRPELLGPLTGVVTINFADESADRLIPRDRDAMTRVPADAETPAHLRFAARATDGGVPGEWAVVGGPMLAELTVEVTAASDGGFAILSAFEEPTTFRVLLIERGAPVRLLDLRAGVISPVEGCLGLAPADEELASRRRWIYRIDEETSSLAVDGRTLLECEPAGAPRRGMVGLGPLGPDGAELRLFQVTVER
jgi:hypothetical protein